MTVIVPFLGDEVAGRALLDALSTVRLGPADRAIVVDNTPGGGLAPDLPEGVTAIRAGYELSSYHARNAGAEVAESEWLLFVDADTRPAADIVDRYLAEQPAAGCGILAGRVVAAEQGVRAARYARSRGHLDEEHHLGSGPFPAGITANLMVRRAAWAALGGFHEGIRSGGDVEFCWRAQEAGWSLERRPDAVVRHVHPERLGRLLAKARRYGAGRRWVNRRYRGVFPRPPIARELARAAAGAVVWPLAGQPERGLFKLWDAAIVLADQRGYLFGDNRAVRPGAGDTDGGRPLVVMTDAYPARSETFVYNEVAELRVQGWSVRVESSARPARVERAAARAGRVDYLEDETTGASLRDLAWLAARHPLGCLRDLAARRRWRREEEVWPLRALAPAARRLARAPAHLHVHFAAGAALHALRIGRLTGVSWDVVGHGYDVFRQPSNLAEKLRSATFAVGPCEYTARALREVAGPGQDVHVVVMGVDAESFRRRSPQRDGRRVVAVGRLVEKKGFEYLVDAAALLRERAPLDELTIVGDGPLRDALRERAEAHGLDGAITILTGAWGADGVRPLLERSQLLAMPAVIAADGDRDAMPVVVKEALAMELPVVASAEVGLPELVEPGWGRLVPPRDAAALADAIEELIALPAERRAEMGAAGREHVERHCSLEAETRKLSALLGR